jgi:hypothetical protein
LRARAGETIAGMTRRLPSPSLAVSITALVVAMGGTGYAATKLSGSNIKAGTITGKQIKSRSLPAGKLSANAIAQLRGAQGPAGPAGPAGHDGADGARGPAGIIGFRTVSSGDVALPSVTQKHGTVKCPAGTIVVGGGVKTSTASPSVAISNSYPEGVDTWSADVTNNSYTAMTFEVRAICLVPYQEGQQAAPVMARPGY